MRWFVILLAGLIALAPSVTDAGTFRISDVSYKTTAASDGNSTIVWVRATADYIGEVDTNDNSWALQTELIALGSVTETVKPGSGIPPDLTIDNEPVTTYGANRVIPDCKTLKDEGNLYRGQAIVAIYHQFTVETDPGVGDWGRTVCDSFSDQPGTGGDGGEEGGTDPAPSDGKISPILIDLDRGGFALTGRNDGVFFDIDGDGERNELAWTAPGSGDGWLALDRDGNGVIDHGGELFGNFTAQPEVDVPDGYRALAVFDDVAQGGDGNGIIDDRDSVYLQLRVWIDANQDGISQPTELRDLRSVGVEWMETRPVISRRQDRHGNELRYQALVRLNKGMSSSVDAFLLMGP